MQTRILVFVLLVAANSANAQAFSVGEEAALARSVLAAIQPTSIAENREYCGVIGLDHNGRLVASRPRRGEEGACVAYTPSNIMVETSSYHTHGGYSPDYVNEVPSVDDIEGDVADGMDGYIATPGGRLWYNDTEAEEIYQLCGLGCLPSDPNFVRGSDGRISTSYSYSELIRKFDR